MYKYQVEARNGKAVIGTFFKQLKVVASVKKT